MRYTDIRLEQILNSDMLVFTKKFLITSTTLVALGFVLTGCANVKTEPADDGYETSSSNGGEGFGSKPPESGSGWLDRQISAALGNKAKKDEETTELNTRLERLEKQQNQGTVQPQTVTNSSDITSPPIGSTRTSPNVGGTNWQNSASYQDWKRAKEGGSSDYKDFQEYKEWLEFKKLQQQNK